MKVKLDTGAEVNVMPLRVHEQIQSKDVKMKTTATKLCVYGGVNLPVVGKIHVKCEFRDAEEQAEFFIVKTDSKTLLSLRTCKSLGIIHMLNEVKSQEQHNEKEDKKDKKQSNGEKDSDFKQNVARIKGKNSKEL